MKLLLCLCLMLSGAVLEGASFKDGPTTYEDYGQVASTGTEQDGTKTIPICKDVPEHTPCQELSPFTGRWSYYINGVAKPHTPTISWTACIEYEVQAATTTWKVLDFDEMPNEKTQWPCTMMMIGWSDGSVSWKRK